MGVVGWVTKVLLSFSRHSSCLHVRMCHHHLCSTGPLTEAYNRGGRQSRKPESHTLNQKITDTGDITSIPPCHQNRALSIYLKLPYKTMCQPQSFPWTSGKTPNLLTIAEMVCWLKPSWDVQENVQNCNVFYCTNFKTSNQQANTNKRWSKGC